MAAGHRLSRLLLFVPVLLFLLPTPVVVVVTATTKISPPENTFCLFTTGELIFEERMKRLAPSAKSAGFGSISRSGAHVRRVDDHAIMLQRMFGAVWYISNDDQPKVLQSAYDRMTLADFEIKLNYDQDNSDRMQCLCMDQGLLPHAFPLPIYTEFPRDLSVRDYTHRLAQLGVSSDYVSWLGTLTPVDTHSPTPAYVRPSWFHPRPLHPPSVQHVAPGDEPGPQYKEYPIPSERLCVLFANELVFEETMKKVVASATTIGAGMLWDRYIALGGGTVSNKSVRYEGFDRVWGVAYTIDQQDFEQLKIYAVKHSFFIAEVRTILEDEYQTVCGTIDIGLLPSGFPFQVYRQNELELNSYLERLSNVGVPFGYVHAIGDLAKSLKQDQSGQAGGVGATQPIVIYY